MGGHSVSPLLHSVAAAPIATVAAAAPVVSHVNAVYRTVHHVPQVHVAKQTYTHTTHHVSTTPPLLDPTCLASLLSEPQLSLLRPPPRLRLKPSWPHKLKGPPPHVGSRDGRPCQPPAEDGRPSLV